MSELYKKSRQALAAIANGSAPALVLAKHGLTDQVFAQALDIELCRIHALLGDIHEFLEGQADADLVDDRYRPNRAMQLMQQIEEWDN